MKLEFVDAEGVVHRAEKRECAGCCAQEVEPTLINYQITHSVLHERLGITGKLVEVPNLMVFKCNACGEIFMNIRADERIDEAVRVAAK